MNNTEIRKPELPFTVSSVFFIIISIIKFFNLYLFPMARFGEFGYTLPIYTAVHIALTVLLAVFLIIRKLFVVNTVIIGLIAANEIYSLLERYNFFRYKGLMAIIEDSFIYIFPIIVWILIFIISIGAIPERAFKSVRKLCFLPIVITFVAMPLYLLCYGSVLLDTILHGSYTNWSYNVRNDVLNLIVYIMEVIAVTLLCKWYRRVIKDQQEAYEALEF